MNHCHKAQSKKPFKSTVGLELDNFRLLAGISKHIPSSRSTLIEFVTISSILKMCSTHLSSHKFVIPPDPSKPFFQLLH